MARVTPDDAESPRTLIEHITNFDAVCRIHPQKTSYQPGELCSVHSAESRARQQPISSLFTRSSNHVSARGAAADCHNFHTASSCAILVAAAAPNATGVRCSISAITSPNDHTSLGQVYVINGSKTSGAQYSSVQHFLVGSSGD